jgi:hypothetical protein
VEPVTGDHFLRIKEWRKGLHVMAYHNDCAADIALLAPVPREHLVDGNQTALTMGKVAFGSRAYDVFLKLDEERGGKPVDVYIYESYGSGQYDFRVSWHARYLGYVGAVDGAHPDGMKYRPASTAKYAGDNEGGDWLLFWEVDLLEEIPEPERLHVGHFMPYGKKKPYGKFFVPRGPMLVEHP